MAVSANVPWEDLFAHLDSAVHGFNTALHRRDLPHTTCKRVAYTQIGHSDSDTQGICRKPPKNRRKDVPAGFRQVS